MTPTRSDVVPAAQPLDAAAFDRLIAALRPRLHRYCARMTGSVVDGEDVLQEALAKALEALPGAGAIDDADAWMFRIAHNAALDHLRQRARREAVHSDEDVAMLATSVAIEDEHMAVETSLRTFMRLPASQRSCVILKDVLGHSIEEIAGVLDGATIASVKAALHRGRARLRELSLEAEPPRVVAPSKREQALIAAYIDRFNARDFDALRAMLADEVRLDLVARTRLSGRTQVGTYYGQYERLADWRFVLGSVDGRPAALAFDPHDTAGAPIYFVLLSWDGDRLVGIRDFRYARYAAEGAEFATLA